MKPRYEYEDFNDTNNELMIWREEYGYEPYIRFVIVKVSEKIKSVVNENYQYRIAIVPLDNKFKTIGEKLTLPETVHRHSSLAQTFTSNDLGKTMETVEMLKREIEEKIETLLQIS